MTRQERTLGEAAFLPKKNIEKRNPVPVWEITEALLTVGATVGWYLFTKNLLEYIKYKRERSERFRVSSKILEQVFPRRLNTRE